MRSSQRSGVGLELGNEAEVELDDLHRVQAEGAIDDDGISSFDLSLGVRLKLSI